MKKKEFSIITATFNSEKTLERTIKSLLQQNFKDFEFIIVDGSSSDNTLDIIKKYKPLFDENYITYKWISEPDKGIYDAWNKGLKLAEGKWVSFLGSDDFYLPNSLQIYYDKIKEMPSNIDLVHSNVKVVDGKKTIKYITGSWSWNIFKHYMNIAHVGAFHNRKLFDKYGTFDESYKIAGDYELLLRPKNKLKTLHIDIVLAVMSAGGISNNKIKQVLLETARAKNKTANINVIKCILDALTAFNKFTIRRIIHAIYR